MTAKAYTQWTLNGQNGISSLVSSQASLPTDLGAHEILVKIYAASLNYRDIVLAQGAKGLQTIPNVVPGSDGAGEVISVGPSVTRFKQGDKVITHLVPKIGSNVFPTPVDISTGLGQAAHGTIREYGVFNEDGLTRMPRNLTFEQASTLTCSGLTAWNALFGGRGGGLKAGDTVLTQGTGGVSVAALQFAHASGATIIATTSSEAKAARLKEMGATHTINYRTDPKWGSIAKSLTADGFGVTNIVDVGGLSTLSESLKAVCVEGVVTVTGVLSDEAEETPSIMDCLWMVCSVRGIFLGTRKQFEEMVEFIEEKGIVPVVDEMVFGLGEVIEAFEYLEKQKHFSKVVIKIA